MVNYQVRTSTTFFNSAVASGLVVLCLAFASTYMLTDRSLLLLGLKPLASIGWCFLGFFQVALGAVIGYDYARLSNMSLSPYRFLPAIIGAFFASTNAPFAFILVQLSGWPFALIYVLNMLFWLLFGLIILCLKEE